MLKNTHTNTHMQCVTICFNVLVSTCVFVVYNTYNDASNPQHTKKQTLFDITEVFNFFYYWQHTDVLMTDFINAHV